MRPVLRDAHVVPVSFPITSFGDPRAARVATLSINPSVIEFTRSDKAHTVLPEGEKRFVDRETLGLSQFDVPTRAQAEQILAGNHNYFRAHPYKKWFDWLENYVLSPIGASFHDGSAVHLDLVQWATYPVWSEISSREVQAQLIADDLQFLTRLLELARFDALFLNGRTVHDTIKKTDLFHIQTEEKIFVAGKAVTFWTGVAAGIPFLCWSKFISDNRTTPAQRLAISHRVREFAATTSSRS
jgi:hypothetical protein